MKSTGIVRKVDELGRIVIPMKLRKTMNIGEKDSLEIFTDGGRIILRKYAPGCIFCESTEELDYFGNKPVCRSCWQKIGRGPGA